MKIFVVSAIGGGEIPLAVTERDTIKAVKQQIASQKRIPPGTVIIVFRGQQLDDNLTLQEATVRDGDKLYLITRTLGG